MAKAAAKKMELPKGLDTQDIVRPDYEDADYSKGDYGQLTLHKTDRFGWCITTLFISRGKRGQPDRSYGISIDGKQTVSIGNGPHVTETVTVYFRKSRGEALDVFNALYHEGMRNANSVRDRRSSRIAEGQQRRARGERSWMWSN
jgi:hypothetical protein